MQPVANMRSLLQPEVCAQLQIAANTEPGGCLVHLFDVFSQYVDAKAPRSFFIMEDPFRQGGHKVVAPPRCRGEGAG